MVNTLIAIKAGTTQIVTAGYIWSAGQCCGEAYMGSMSMVIDKIKDDEDFISPTEEQAPAYKYKKLLFAGGLDFSAESLHICVHCRRAKDTQGVWHKVDRRLIFFNDIKLVQDTCDDCKKKD